MTDKEIITKAVKVLKELRITFDKNSAPTICRYKDIPKILYPILNEGDKDHFFVSFELTLPGGTINHISVNFDSKTYKIMNRYGIYEIPKGFE